LLADCQNGGNDVKDGWAIPVVICGAQTLEEKRYPKITGFSVDTGYQVQTKI